MAEPSSGRPPCRLRAALCPVQGRKPWTPMSSRLTVPSQDPSRLLPWNPVTHHRGSLLRRICHSMLHPDWPPNPGTVSGFTCAPFVQCTFQEAPTRLPARFWGRGAWKAEGSLASHVIAQWVIFVNRVLRCSPPQLRPLLPSNAYMTGSTARQPKHSVWTGSTAREPDAQRANRKHSAVQSLLQGAALEEALELGWRTPGCSDRRAWAPRATPGGVHSGLHIAWNLL